LTFIPLIENNVTNPKTKAKSATFDPNNVPTLNSGIPFNAEITDIVVSGETEILK